VGTEATSLLRIVDGLLARAADFGRFFPDIAGAFWPAQA
jgi:hypothetical protein